MIPSTLNVENAISLIRSGKIDTEASEAVQQSIQSKIQQYSKGTSHTLHYAKCYLPTDVAFLLKKNPNFLGPAVNAFYYRDVDSMKVINHSFVNIITLTISFLVLCKDAKIFT